MSVAILAKSRFRMRFTLTAHTADLYDRLPTLGGITYQYINAIKTTEDGAVRGYIASECEVGSYGTTVLSFYPHYLGGGHVHFGQQTGCRDIIQFLDCARGIWRRLFDDGEVVSFAYTTDPVVEPGGLGNPVARPQSIVRRIGSILGIRRSQTPEEQIMEAAQESAFISGLPTLVGFYISNRANTRNLVQPILEQRLTRLRGPGMCPRCFSVSSTEGDRSGWACLGCGLRKPVRGSPYWGQTVLAESLVLLLAGRREWQLKWEDFLELWNSKARL